GGGRRLLSRRRRGGPHRGGCRTARGRAAPRSARRGRSSPRDRALLLGRHRASPRRDLRAGGLRGVTFVRNRWIRAAIALLAAGGVVALLWWRGPAWSGVASAFAAVKWSWVVAAIGLNLLSVLVRALAWRTVINQAFDPPYPRFLLVFSAFSVGLFANAILPGRIGELARV